MEAEIKKIQFFNNLEVSNDEKIAEYELKLQKEKEQKRKSDLEEHYRLRSGVSSRYLSESLETYRPTKENERAYKWIIGFVNAIEKKENTKNLLFLNGKYGTGKTHLGCGMIRRLGGRIITSLELCITYESCRDFKAEMTRIQFLKKLCESPVLVIDEIGKGITSIEKEIYPYIVNEFYGSGRILIFLGNLLTVEFFNIIGEAGKDRFAESGINFSLVGESKRKPC